MGTFQFQPPLINWATLGGGFNLFGRITISKQEHGRVKMEQFFPTSTVWTPTMRFAICGAPQYTSIGWKSWGLDWLGLQPPRANPNDGSSIIHQNPLSFFVVGKIQQSEKKIKPIAKSLPGQSESPSTPGWTLKSSEGRDDDREFHGRCQSDRSWCPGARSLLAPKKMWSSWHMGH